MFYFPFFDIHGSFLIIKMLVASSQNTTSPFSHEVSLGKVPTSLWALSAFGFFHRMPRSPAALTPDL
jgi:hypothetical protein